MRINLKNLKVKIKKIEFQLYIWTLSWVRKKLKPIKLVYLCANLNYEISVKGK
jgi:hypothetical protein